MDHLYTEKMLKAMNKEKLLAIAADNKIKVDDNMKNDDVKRAILQKGCLIPAEVNRAEAGEAVAAFNKKQLLESNWYSHRRDMLNALLDDDKTYSHAQVQYLMDTFMKGRVDE